MECKVERWIGAASAIMSKRMRLQIQAVKTNFLQVVDVLTHGVEPLFLCNKRSQLRQVHGDGEKVLNGEKQILCCKANVFGFVAFILAYLKKSWLGRRVPTVGYLTQCRPATTHKWMGKKSGSGPDYGRSFSEVLKNIHSKVQGSSSVAVEVSLSADEHHLSSLLLPRAEQT